MYGAISPSQTGERHERRNAGVDPVGDFGRERRGIEVHLGVDARMEVALGREAPFEGAGALGERGRVERAALLKGHRAEHRLAREMGPAVEGDVADAVRPPQVNGHRHAAARCGGGGDQDVCVVGRREEILDRRSRRRRRKAAVRSGTPSGSRSPSRRRARRTCTRASRPEGRAALAGTCPAATPPPAASAAVSSGGRGDGRPHSRCRRRTLIERIPFSSRSSST